MAFWPVKPEPEGMCDKAEFIVQGPGNECATRWGQSWGSWKGHVVGS